MDKGFLSKMRKTGRRIIVLNVYQNGTIFQGPKEGGFKGIVADPEEVKMKVGYIFWFIENRNTILRKYRRICNNKQSLGLDLLSSCTPPSARATPPKTPWSLTIS